MNTQAIEPKTWATLTARAEMAGYALLRTDPAYRPLRLLVARIGLIKQIGSVADLEALQWVLSNELGLHTLLRAGTQGLPRQAQTVSYRWKSWPDAARTGIWPKNNPRQMRPGVKKRSKQTQNTPAPLPVAPNPRKDSK